MSRAWWCLAVLLSHWRRHPMQLATLLIGLIAATALWSGVQALNQQARSSYDRAASVFGGARTATLVGRDGPTFPQSLYVAIRRAGWPVSPLLEGRVQIAGKPLRVLGIDPVTLPSPSPLAGEGRGGGSNVGTSSASTPTPNPSPQGGGERDLLVFLTPPYEALAAPETLKDLGLHERDMPALANGLLLPPLRAQSQLLPGVLVVDIGIAQKLLGQPDQVSRLLIGPGTQRRASLESIVSDRLRLVEPSSESDLERLTDSFHLNLTAFGLLSFVVGLFIVNSAVGLAFEQRLPMLRTLRACGISARMLNAVLVGELVSIALVAGLVGLVCGYLIAASLLPDVAASLRGLYGAQIPGQLTLQPQWWVAGIAISILGALAAAATSLVKAARLPLLATAQPYAWQVAQQRLLTLQGLASVAVFGIAGIALWFGDSLAAGFAVLAAIMLGAALALPVVLGFVLKAGERGSTRPLISWFWADSRLQLSGLSLALMALLLALAVNVGVGTMVSGFSKTFTGWLDGRLAAEIYLNAKDDKQAVEIAAWLTQRRDVDAILPSARADVQVSGWPVEILGFADHATYRTQWPLLESRRDAWDHIATGNGALISEQLSRRLKLRIGDHIDVPTPSGTWPLEIVAIYADYGNPKGQIGVATDALVRRFPDTPRTRFGLRVKPDTAPELVAEIRKTFGLDDRSVADQATVKAESLRIFNRTFAVTSALNAFTLGVAGVALLTSLLTLSNSRLPQLAPLWALGITRKRLALIELLKTMAVALITALLALPLGLLVAWCLIAVVNVKAFGWRLPFHVFPVQLLELLGVAMIAAFLAALLPILRLLRMQPAELVKVFANER